MRMKLILAATVFATPVLAAGPEVSFPTEYRSWNNYYSNDRSSVEGQYIRCYANDIAIEAARAGGEIPVGAKLVGELWSVLKDGDKVIYSTLDARIADAHGVSLVMERIAGADAAYADGLEVGDWAFAAFNADGTPREGGVAACRECHAPLDGQQHLWTYEHLAKKPLQ